MTTSTIEYVFLPPQIPSVEIAGTEQRFPVHRIYCVGRNYADHAGEIRQKPDVGEMMWGVSEIIAELSTLFELKAGDLIYTGTPAGVRPLKPGDQIECGVDGLETLRNTVTPGITPANAPK